MAAGALDRWPGDRLQADQVTEDVHLRRFAGGRSPRFDLLQGDDVGVEALDDAGHTFDITPAVAADTAVNVVRRHREARRGVAHRQLSLISRRPGTDSARPALRSARRIRNSAPTITATTKKRSATLPASGRA